MILASSREDFTNTVFHAPLQLRAGDGSGDVSIGELQNQCRGQQVDILIHGYRNEFDSALAAYISMNASLSDAGIPGQRIGFFWCGSWAKLGFTFAVLRTKKAAVELKRLTDALNDAGCTVNVETHSLGARVALQALKIGARFDRLILTAPAVDADCLALGGEFGNCIRRVRQATVMWSARDSVLRWAYWVASGFRKALGLVGPAPNPGVRSRDLTLEVSEHSAYKSVPAVYDREVWRG